MFEFIKGILIHTEPAKAIVDVNGIGYKLLIPVNYISLLPPIGNPVFFYVSAVIREDAHLLYGFLKKREQELFEVLLTISGIGPKTALAVLGCFDFDQFHTLVSNADVFQLSKVPGIGKKTSERLVLEMKDKWKHFEKEEKDFSSSEKSSPISSDALSALRHLGYHPIQAQKAIRAVLKEKTPKDVAELITLALQKI